MPETEVSSFSSAGLLFSLLFNPEDGGDMFLRNVGCPRTTPRYDTEHHTLEYLERLSLIDFTGRWKARIVYGCSNIAIIGSNSI
jgi:hypothetical protein